MMEQTWRGILGQYGQEVTLRQGEKAVSLRAFLQPALNGSAEQKLPTPLGLGRKDRFLYLGPADHPLDTDTLVEWNEREFRVQSAHLVGENVCPHWWAMLYPRDEVVL